MGTADVVAFVTSAAHQRDENMLFKFGDQIRHSFANSGNPHTVDYTPAAPKPTAPTQQPYGTTFTGSPCGTSKQYDNLLDWWRDWYSCRYSPAAYDSVLLITDALGGGGLGLLGGKFAVAGAAGISRKDDWPATFQCGIEGYDMTAALHEVGHNLDLDHTDGDIHTYSNVPDRYYPTTMISGYGRDKDAQNNNCGEYIEDTSDESTRCNKLVYSPCSESSMVVSQGDNQ